jgi:hypothetical protein
MHNNYSFWLFATLLAISGQLLSQSVTKILRSNMARIGFSADHISPMNSANGGWIASMRGLGNQQVAIARFNNAGEVIWATLLEGRRDVDALMVLEDAGVLVFGNNQEVNNYFDPTVVHLSATGEVISEAVYGLPSELERWTTLERLSDGSGLAIINEFVFPDDVVAIYKFASDGSLTWERRVTHDIFGDFDAVIATADGGFCLVGSGNWSDFPGVALLKMDANGNLEWQKSYETADYELKMTQGVELVDGSLLMTGPSFEFGRMLMMKTDGQGEAEWIQEVDGAFDFYHPIAWDADTIIVGTTSPAQVVGSSFETEILLYRFGLDGSLLGADTYGTDSLDVPYDIQWGGGQLLIAGATGDGGGADSTRAFVQLLQPNTAPCKATFEALDPISLGLPTPAVEFILGELDKIEKTEFTAVTASLPLVSITGCSDIVSVNNPSDCLRSERSLIDWLNSGELTMPDMRLQIIDMQGRTLGIYDQPTAAVWPKLQSNLPVGIYFYTIKGSFCTHKQVLRGKFWLN